MSNPQLNRLHQLVEQLVNGTISADQHDELQQLLKESPETQSAYFEMMDLHMGLQKLTTTDPVDEHLPFPNRQFSPQDSASTQTVNSSNCKRNSSPAFLSAMIALAVVALVGVSFFLPEAEHEFQQAEGPVSVSSTEHHVAQESLKQDDILLTQAAGAELFGEFLPSVGSALEYEHDYALVAGLIELHFPDGAEVILEAPSLIKITGRDRLLVSAGQCSVHAPPGAEGFQIETPQTEITDLGTRFSVSVSDFGETDVQVVEGLAEVLAKRNVSAEPIRLTERQARRFNGSLNSKSMSIEFDANDYRKKLPDRIVSYDVHTTEAGYAWDLKNVRVQRNGIVQTVDVNDLIGIKLIHFRGGTNNLNVVVPVGFEGDRLSGIESDKLLHTGIINPGGSVEPLSLDPILETDDTGQETTPGMAFEFDKAVVNRPGPDVVFFELQNVTNPLEGDAFHVSPLQFDNGLRTHTIRRYDITMTSREAQLLPDIDLLFFSESAKSLESLQTTPVDRRLQSLRFRGLAVGIDLSDLGYEQGAAVKGLFIQDAMDDKHYVDPVFVAGLPDNS